MEIELRHLRAFVAVAHERHFGRAAALLNVAQPPLSRQIRRLEEELGSELFDRTTRPISLTAAGVAFLKEAQLALDQAERALERGRRIGRGELSHLSIGALPWAYNGIVPWVVQRFRDRLPGVTLELATLDPADQADALEKGRLDVGFVAFAHQLPERSGLHGEAVAKEQLVAIVSESHPLAERASVSLEELAKEPRVSISRASAPGLADEQTALFRGRGLTSTAVHEASDIPGLFGLIAAGVGIGLHVESFKQLRRQGVTFVPLEDAAPTVTLCLLWRRNDERELVRGFVDTARKVAREGAMA